MKTYHRPTKRITLICILLFVSAFITYSGSVKANNDKINYNIYVIGEDRSPCSQILAAAGHTVTTVSDVAALTHVNLSIYDQVWYVDTKFIPDLTGHANLKNFIISGGKVFFMGDSYRWYRADLADWRDSLFNELGAGGIKQSKNINPSQESYYTNPFHTTSFTPNEVHYIQHGPGRNGSFESIGNGTVIVGAGIDAKGDAIALAFDYGTLMQAQNSRAIIYLNSNNKTNWDLYAENLAKFLGPKNKTILSVRNSKALPGSTGRMKIDLHNMRPVSGVQFKMKDEPDILTAIQFVSTNRDLNFSIDSQEDEQGFLTVVVSNDHGDNIKQGNGCIGELIFQVNTDAVIGDSADIILSEEIILDEFGEILASDVINGKFVCGILKGDVVIDGIINVFDLVRTIDIILGRSPEPTESEMEAADFNSDGIVNILDIVGIINELLGREPVTLLEKPNVYVKTQNQILTNTSEIPLPIFCEKDLMALQINLSYDSNKIISIEPVLTPRSSELEFAFENQNGKMTLILYSLDGKVIKAGDGSIINFQIQHNSQIDVNNILQINNMILVDLNQATVATKIDDSDGKQNLMSRDYSLLQNYPNPFNNETEISYFLPKTEKINLGIYNLLGIKIRTLVDERQTVGYHKIIWNGQTDGGKIAPSGIYFYRLFSNNFSVIRKLSMIK